MGWVGMVLLLRGVSLMVRVNSTSIIVDNKSYEQGLNLSGSKQQGLSTAYNTPFELSRLQRIYPLKQWIVVIHRTVGSDWLTSRFRTGLHDTVVALAGYEYSQLRLV